MKTGIYFDSNQIQVSKLSDSDWEVALAKCKTHIKWKLKQKTLTGAHSASNLGGDPYHHYLNLAYDKLLTGEWEWQEGFSLSEQLIRIADSCISKTIEKAGTEKAKALQISYKNVEVDFYDLASPATNEDEIEHALKVAAVEESIRGDKTLEYMFSAIKEGKKRSEIAELMEITPRQLDKLRERFIKTAQKKNTSKASK